MFKQDFLLTFIILFSLTVSGCMVTKDTYMKKVAEADNQAKDLTTLQQKYKVLTDENGNLKNKINALISDRDQLKEAFANATKDKEKLTAEKEELDKVLQSKSDTLSKNIWDLRKAFKGCDKLPAFTCQRGYFFKVCLIFNIQFQTRIINFSRILQFDFFDKQSLVFKHQFVPVKR